ncbi:MAG: hypothetical protein EOO10_02650 [Chitinophagaceae bacterium]|nr:MAG: hypothetical protein EOO10_02650 [Chitinophagaceae bacterium]
MAINFSFDGLTGLTGVGTTQVDNSGNGQFAIRLTKGCLAMPTNGVMCTAQFNTATNTLQLQAALLAPYLFFYHQFELESLQLTLQAQQAQPGNYVFRTAAGSLLADGVISWKNPIVGKLGVAGNAIKFRIRFGATQGGVGFYLELMQTPLGLTSLGIVLDNAFFNSVITPATNSVTITLASEGGLANQLQTKLKNALSLVYPLRSLTNLTKGKFFYQQTFSLNAAQNVIHQSNPTLSIAPVMDNISALPLPDLGALGSRLKLDLGVPNFSFELRPQDIAFPSIESFGFVFKGSFFELTDINLPAALKGLRLQGDCRYVTISNGIKEFSFVPYGSVEINFPDITRLLFSKLKWLGNAGQTLNSLASKVTGTETELYIYTTIKGLLTDLPNLSLALEQFINSVKSLPGAPALPRIFALAFHALESDPATFAKVWDVWFKLHVGSSQLPQAARLFGELLALLRPDNIQALAEALFRRPNFELEEFLKQIFIWANDVFLAHFLDVTGLLVVLSNAWLNVTATLDRFVNALVRILTADALPANFRRFYTMSDFGLSVPGLSLSTPSFRVQGGVWITGLLLQSLAIPVVNKYPNAFAFPHTITALKQFGEWMKVFLNNRLSPFGQLATDEAFLRFVSALVNNAQNDEKSERLIIQLARICPLFGVFSLSVIAIASLLRTGHNLLTSPFKGNLFYNVEEQSAAGNLLSHRFDPVAGRQRKFLIFSDVHRDAVSDKLNYFEFGAIEHFLNNQTLYAQILDWATANDYTVIENGDCEELWFIRDFETHAGYEKKLEEILATHQLVYEKLVQLHKQRRYFRTYGNHDSQLRTRQIGDVLKRRFEVAGAPVFKIFDYLIIDGVKTMGDRGFGDLLSDIAQPTDRKKDSILGKLAAGRIGYDSSPYEERKPLIVTHGHQWDFWNCDENNLLGKILANTGGVWADMLNDPFLDLGGIAFSGAPMIDLEKFLAEPPVFNNFLSYTTAAEFAHTIQHQYDKLRLLNDDLFYSETLPALASLLFMPLDLKKLETNGTVRTTRWRDSLQNGNAGNIFNHLFNQLAIGHTHFPHSRPYFDMEGMLLGSPLQEILQGLRQWVGDKFFGFQPSLNLRSQLYNSGTSGWMEGVIWALEVDETGQARLIYWTKDTKLDHPQTMDWELQRWSPEKRQALQNKLQEIENNINKFFEPITLDIKELSTVLAHSAAVPFEALASLMNEYHRQPVDIALTEPVVGGRSPESLAEQALLAKKETTKLAEALIHVMLSAIRCQLPPAVATKKQIQLTMALPPSVLATMGELDTVLNPLKTLFGVNDADLLLRMKLMWLLLIDNLPTFNAGIQRLRSLPDFSVQRPVMMTFLAMLVFLPKAAPQLKLKSTLSLSANVLTAHLEIG